MLEIKDYDAITLKQGERLGLWGFNRPGFENTFTIAVTNMSTTKTFNELTPTFLFENKDGGDLPEILDVTFTKLDPNGLTLLHKYISINPKNNRWRVTGISPGTFAIEEVEIAFTTTEEAGKRRVQFTIPAIAPRDSWVIEIKTDLFDPVQTGTGVFITTESLGSPSFNNPPAGGDVFVLFPEDQRDFNDIPLPSEDPNSPYVDPFDPDNNIYTEPKDVYAPSPYQSNIFSAYDPNDKLVAGGNALEINETNISRKWLTYTIRFENTGNFSAKDVYIIDELEENIIPDSFTLLESSDIVEIDFLPSGSTMNPTLRFSFNNIFLPFDDANNDGWVKFRVRVKEDIAENTIVNNTAAIYFDQNPPIITNTIQNLFKTPEVAVDTEAPNMVCQNFIAFLGENGQVTIEASSIDLDSTDNEGIVSLELDITIFDCSNLGENEVALTGTDAAGNSASCTAIVTIEDEFPPEVVCIDPFSIFLDENGIATITVDEIDNGSTDTCSALTYMLDVETFSCDNLGDNPVTLTVTDASNNFSTCTVTVTIIDEIAPEIDLASIPEDQTIFADEGTMFYTMEDFTTNLIVNDSCDVTITQDPVAGTELATEVYTVTFTITDTSGNTSTESFELFIDEVLGIGENVISTMTVYPNPVRDVLNIDFQEPINSIQLYDMLGRLVKQQQAENTVNVSDLPQAMYILKVTSDTSTQTFQVIKQ